MPTEEKGEERLEVMVAVELGVGTLHMGRDECDTTRKSRLPTAWC